MAFVVAAPANATLSLTPAFTGGSVTQPMFVTSPPGDTHRLFIVTRPGVIRVAVDGVLQPTPFLDIQSRVWSGAGTGEAGMLSMAFDPGYSNPASPGYGLVYVYFVRPPAGGGSNGPIRIEEFHVDVATAPDVVTSSTGRLVLEIPHNDDKNHYGGTLQFHPNDNLLYIATGDGGASDNQYLNAQDTKKSLLGKLLRIDPHQTMSEPYSIPGSNPFAGQPLCNPPSTTTNCPEILAWGLRNPFRWSFDADTGDLAIGDVGQAMYEEIDYVPAASALASDNFGWPCREGAVSHVASSDPRCGTTGPFVNPVHQYAHVGISGSVAITGGVVVRDPSLGPVLGRYLWADFYQGVVHSLTLGTPAASDDRVEADLPKVPQLVSFGQDAQKQVYVVSLGGNSVQRLVCTGDCDPPPPSPDPGGGTPPPSPPGSGSPPGEQPPPASGEPGPVPIARDASAPLLRIRAAHVQDVLRRHLVRLSVACDEACIVRVSGRIRGGAARASALSLRGALKRLSADKRVVFELRASARIRRALARRGSVAITIRGRDAAGNLRTAGLRVGVKRR
jgi:glucose/arabinose dehydrogenase